MRGRVAAPVSGAMELFPAIDLHDGAAVRLVQGDFARVRDYGDPLALARLYVTGGAPWIHVVDLDAARTGEPVNRDVVLAIADAVDVRVQAGGGVRGSADAAALLDHGVERVVLGTAALETPELVESLAARYPGRVAVGLDHRGAGAELAVRGWERPSGTTLGAALDRLASVDLGAVVVTAIDRDGMLGGPDLVGLRGALDLTVHDVVASGGVRSPADLVALAALASSGPGARGLAGAIVGTALVEHAMTIEEAIAACVPSV
jgi:phosphoribosylformimino-5-aminoimidazole carboxamide ribotide isomerase